MTNINSNKSKVIKMNLEETIYKRQSIRSYEETPLDDKEIGELKTFIENTKALNDNIQWSYDIVSKDKVRSILQWRSPQYLLLFSEEKENYRENIGFIFQQVDLFLQSKGIGTCWLGMLSPNGKYDKKNDGHKFVIAISVGYPVGEIYRNPDEFQRKALTEITDREDRKLRPLQYAPSATNSQPWYITHNTDGTYNIYREKLGLIKRNIVGRWNPIDIGIALAHIYITNRETFKFTMEDNPMELNNYIYEGTFEI